MAKEKKEKHPEIIISHPGTDFDSMASMWAAHLLYPSRPVVLIGAADSNVREFLALYDHEFPRLHLREIDIGAVNRVTVVDCSSRSQLSRIEGLLNRVDVYVEVWDHHQKEGYEFRIDEHHYSKVGANTTVLIQELINNGLQVSPEEATLLLLGIYEDTGSLRFPSTTPSDFEAAAWLLRAGGSLDVADKFLGIKLTGAQKELLTNLGLNVRVVEVRGIEIHVTTATAVEFVDEIAFLAKKVQETENADVLFTLVQLNDRVFIVGRSRIPSVNVGDILSTFGGGGHPQAASCLLTGTNHSVALQRLLDAVREQVMPTMVARDIMSSPVRSIGPDASIEEAHTLIAHTGFSGLVVVNGAGEIVGIITRSDVDKALQHRLGHAPVKGYMAKNPEVLNENTGIGEIQNIIIRRRAGFLPVVERGKLTGVVTRTDVLRALHSPAVSPDKETVETGGLTHDEFGKDLLNKLPGTHLDILASAGEIADNYGHKCYLVGGIVRDLVLGRPNIDIDLLIEGNGIEFAHHLAISLQGRVIENERFRTAKIVLHGNFLVDVATARDEFYVHPGALPEVEAAGIRDDLVRRDFTVNTLAIQLNTRKWGHFVDLFGGLSDIRDGLIRVLHTFSFVDDPTRILRALRFSVRFGFTLESQTEELLKRALVEGRLDDISPERVRDELILCLSEEKPWPILVRLFDEGVLGVLHQAIYSPAGLPAMEDPIVPALEWISRYLDPGEVPDKVLAYLALLLSGANVEDAVKFVRKYNFDHEVIKLAEGQSEYMKACEILSDPLIKPSDLAHALEHLPKPCWVTLAAGHDDESPVRRNIKKYLTELRGIELEIDGKDLIEAGFEPGPAFGRALEAVRAAKLDGEVDGWVLEMELARKIMGEE